MFKKLGVITVAMLVMVGCSPEDMDNSDEEVTDDVEVVEEVDEVKAEETEEVEEVEEEIEEVEEEIEEVEEDLEQEIEDEGIEAFDRSDRVYLALTIMQSDFEEIADVEYDAEQDAVVIIPTEQGFSDELLFMMTGLMDRASWDNMVENFQYLSETMTELVDADLKFAIANPENTDNMILVVQDGVVMYNVADELD